MILHFQVTSQNQNILLNRPIAAQQMIFRRGIVCNYATVPIPAAGGTLGGGVIVQPNFLSGLEIVSGDQTGNNDIMIAMDQSIPVNDKFYNWNFNSETTPQAFTVRTLDFERKLVKFYADEKAKIPSVLPGEGMIKSIDLFFEFQNIQQFDGF